jgi:short subunit dehydrogenase-like uncharacterized protein
MTAPAPRVLLLGATGYTGRLAARDMVRRGVAPILLGRDGDRLRLMVDELAPEAPGESLPSFEVVDLDRPASLQRLLHAPDNVLVSTVGPFARRGRAAVEAAIAAGCAYIDTTEEPLFIRRVFDDYGPRAEQTGARLLPAFGFCFVPGNLAGALLLRRYPAAEISRIDIGYFVTGGFTPSSGTIASSAQIALDPSHTLRRGKIITERPGARSLSFEVDGQAKSTVSIGGTEQYCLPRIAPRLQAVNTQAGWIGRWSLAWSAAGALAGNPLQVPGVGAAVGAVMRSALGGASATGPADHQRARNRTVVIAAARNPAGGEVGRVRVEGPNPYDLTAALLRWGTQMLVRRAEKGSGALGPVDAFGFDAFTSGCLALGIVDDL